MAVNCKWREIELRNQWSNQTRLEWNELKQSKLGSTVIQLTDLHILERLFSLRNDIRHARDRLDIFRQEVALGDNGNYAGVGPDTLVRLELQQIDGLATLETKCLRMEEKCGLTPDARTAIEKRSRINDSVEVGSSKQIAEVVGLSPPPQVALPDLSEFQD